MYIQMYFVRYDLVNLLQNIHNSAFHKNNGETQIFYIFSLSTWVK